MPPPHPRRNPPHYPGLRIEALNAASVDAARSLLLEYGRFVLDSEGPSRFCFGDLQREVDHLSATFDGDRGQLLLAWVDAAPAGCVTWRAMKSIPGGCEMKRLWVRPQFRGLRLGERLVAELIERARTAGFTAVYLDTVPASMASACRMYQRMGFKECAPYHASPRDGLAFMRLSLDSGSR
jgi:ribosomal protein S18 acetylase RimI-like enzyme